MMVVNTADELAIAIAEASVLVVSRLLANFELLREVTVVVHVLAASTSRKRYLVAELDFSTGERRIEDAVIIDLSELTKFDLEVAVVALSPNALERNICILIAVLTMLTVDIVAVLCKIR